MAESLQTRPGLWRSGKRLLIRHGSGFPRECVRCAVPVDAANFKVKLVWSPYGSAHSRSVVGRAAFLATRRSVTLKVGLCAACRKRRRLVIGSWITVMICGVILAAVMIWLGQTGRVYTNTPLVAASALAGCALAFAPLMVIAFQLALLKPELIENGWIIVRGAGESFLALLPEHVGPGFP